MVSQAAVQALNLVTGFLVIRYLSVEQYSVYIAAMMLVSVAASGADRYYACPLIP